MWVAPLSFHYYFNESKSSCKDYDDAIKFRFMSCAPDRAGPGGTSSSKLASFASAALLFKLLFFS